MLTNTAPAWSWNLDVEDACRIQDYRNAWKLWQAGLNAIEQKIPVEIPSTDAEILEALNLRYQASMAGTPIFSPWGPSPARLIKSCEEIITHCAENAPAKSIIVRRLEKPTAEGDFLDEENRLLWENNQAYKKLKESVWTVLFEHPFLAMEMGGGLDRFQSGCHKTFFKPRDLTARTVHFAEFVAKTPERMQAWGETLHQIPFSAFNIPHRMEMASIHIIAAALRRRGQISPKQLPMWDETVQGMATLHEFATLRMAMAQAKENKLAQTQFDRNFFDFEEYNQINYVEFASLRSVAHASLAFPHRGGEKHWREYRRILPQKAMGLALYHIGLQGSRFAHNSSFLGSYKGLLYSSLAPLSSQTARTDMALPVPAHDLAHTLASIVATHDWVLRPEERRAELIEYSRETIPVAQKAQAAYYMGRLKRATAPFFYSLQSAIRPHLDKMREIEVGR